MSKVTNYNLILNNHELSEFAMEILIDPEILHVRIDREKWWQKSQNTPIFKSKVKSIISSNSCTFASLYSK